MTIFKSKKVDSVSGCDQKHEEEMDSEKIYKNFVLRVSSYPCSVITDKIAVSGNY